ncbi:hypothetical protein [Paenibacillus polymyxa]|uniref:hypothetical protein n=1 Tax=Paenibacillus polymyxa TaxID=1406 RepID=UPI00046F45A0|nr:hypothetical protein [Paenibacillus polymyxa]
MNVGDIVVTKHGQKGVVKTARKWSRNVTIEIKVVKHNNCQITVRSRFLASELHVLQRKMEWGIR